MAAVTDGEFQSGGAVQNLQNSVAGWMQAIAPFGIFTTDSDLRIRSWNHWLASHSGMLPAQVIGRPLLEVFPDLQERRLIPRFKRALEGEISVLSTALHKHLLPLPVTMQAGSLRNMLQTARIAPLPGDDGGIAGTITIIEDVTQREFQAGARRRQQELDRLLSAALGALLQSSDPAEDVAKIFAPIMPSFGLDAYFCYLWHPASRAFRLHASAGISPKQRENMATAALDPADATNSRGAPVSADATLSVHLSLLQSLGIRGRCGWALATDNQAIGFVSFGSYQSRQPSDADEHLLFRISHFLAIAIDRTAKEREAVAASQAKDDFLAALSHELRTPLNPVLLVASDAVDNEDYPPEAREAFRVIEKNAQLEARLIDDLLDLTRIEHGKLRLELRQVDAHVAVRDAIANVRPDAEAKSIAIDVKLDAPDSVIEADPARLQQIFWNVMKNGIKFTPAGGTLRVATALNAKGDQWVLEITDSGIGMEPHEIGRIFQAFIQGDHARAERGHRFGGLGLGLAICHKLVELHAGQIEAISAGKDRGSTFRLHFPLKQPGVSGNGDASQTAGKGSARSSVNPFMPPQYRILVVEDHGPTRNTLVSVLTRKGYDVVCVGTASEAMSAATATKFDLVLSDLGLPDMDGNRLMAILRDRLALPGIALTGYGTEADITKSAAAGFIAHLTKPINVTMLERTLRDVLGGSRPPIPQ